jgi:hypothetical protein
MATPRITMPGRAVAALQAVVFAKRLLHRVQRAIAGLQAFNGGMARR